MDVESLPALCLMGPTASGKSALALALAQHLPVELVSVDSAQVYRGLDIGSAKPTPAERAAVPHHLLDIRDPSQTYSAAQFREDAQGLLQPIRARGRLPLLVGGTFLYFRALMGSLSDLPAADPAVRAALQADLAQRGPAALHERLARQAPERARQLHPNDTQRVLRALEILELGGRPAAAAGLAPVAANAGFLRLVIEPSDRLRLHADIEARFLGMMEQGLLEEVRALHGRQDLHPGLPAIRAVGYRQLWSHLDGEQGLDHAIAAGIAATRQLAKRQITWLRSEPADLRLAAGGAASVKAALNLLQRGRPKGAC